MTTHGDSLVSSVLNFRDIGTLPAEGGITRTGVLFRSGDLSAISDADREILRQQGITQIVDLRSDDEVESKPNQLAEWTVSTTRIPLFIGSAGSFLDNGFTFDDAYGSLLHNSAPRIAETVRAVVSQHPVLVHCTLGKDRTGITVAVMLAAVGVREEAIVADYARTEDFLPEDTLTRVYAPLIDQIAEHPERERIIQMVTRAPAAAMAQVLAHLRREYGGAAEYLRRSGVTDQQLSALREALIRPE